MRIAWLLPVLMFTALLAGCGGSDASRVEGEPGSPSRSEQDTELRDTLYVAAARGPALCRTQNDNAYGSFEYLVGDFCMASDTMTLSATEESVAFCDLRPDASEYRCADAGPGSCWVERAKSQTAAGLRPSPVSDPSRLVIGVCTYASADDAGTSAQENDERSEYIRFSFRSDGATYFIGEDSGGKYRCETSDEQEGTAGKLQCTSGWLHGD